VGSAGKIVSDPVYVVGDVIRVLSVGDWLLTDLLPKEQEGIRACVGKEMAITEIDKWGGIWVGFGTTVDELDGTSSYQGQSFIVEPDRIELVKQS
jgi:hypothetical protein